MGSGSALGLLDWAENSEIMRRGYPFRYRDLMSANTG